MRQERKRDVNEKIILLFCAEDNTVIKESVVEVCIHSASILDYLLSSVRLNNMKICVIGAGVVGLNTSIALLKEYPNADVTILADKFTTETVSDVAAGLFRPSSSFSGPTDEITR